MKAIAPPICIAAFVLGLLLSPWLGAQAAPGGAEDPLVSKTYVDRYVAEQFDPLAARLTAIQRALNSNGKIVLTIGSANAEVNGDTLAIDQQNSRVTPYIDGNNRTMVPVRFLAEQLGASISWEGATRQVTVSGNGALVQMTIDSAAYTVDGVSRTMDTAPVINTGWDRTMAPARFLAEALGATVTWDPDARTVTITP